MYVLVVSRVGSSTIDPLVYGPYSTSEEAEQAWEKLEGLRSLFADLLAHHVVPLDAGVNGPVAAPPAPNVYITQPIYVQPAPAWLWPSPNYYPYRVTWGSNPTYIMAASNGALSA